MNNQEIQLHKAGINDIPEILLLIRELATYEKLIDSVEADEENLSKFLFGKKRYAEVIIAEYNGETAGQALYFYNFSTFRGRPGIYLEDIYVRPHLRGKGIGRALFNELIKNAIENECGRIEWVVLNWNISAIGFYEQIKAYPLKEWITYRLEEKDFKNTLNPSE